VLACCEFRNEVREEGRRGVVGREGMRVREAERDRCRCGGKFGVVDDILEGEFGGFWIEGQLWMYEVKLVIGSLVWLGCALRVHKQSRDSSKESVRSGGIPRMDWKATQHSTLVSLLDFRSGSV
jgi:hypothetical protein